MTRPDSSKKKRVDSFLYFPRIFLKNRFRHLCVKLAGRQLYVAKREDKKQKSQTKKNGALEVSFEVGLGGFKMSAEDTTNPRMMSVATRRHRALTPLRILPIRTPWTRGTRKRRCRQKCPKVQQIQVHRVEKAPWSRNSSRIVPTRRPSVGCVGRNTRSPTVRPATC